jgi:hypothetical protein
MKAKQRYQSFHLCVQRGLGPVRRHNTGIEMELRTPPESFCLLVEFSGVLDSHDGVSGCVFLMGRGCKRQAWPFDLFVFLVSLFSLPSHTQDKTAIA